MAYLQPLQAPQPAENPEYTRLRVQADAVRAQALCEWDAEQRNRLIYWAAHRPTSKAGRTVTDHEMRLASIGNELLVKLGFEYLPASTVFRTELVDSVLGTMPTETGHPLGGLPLPFEVAPLIYTLTKGLTFALTGLRLTTALELLLPAATEAGNGFTKVVVPGVSHINSTLLTLVVGVFATLRLTTLGQVRAHFDGLTTFAVLLRDPLFELTEYAAFGFLLQEPVA